MKDDSPAELATERATSLGGFAARLSMPRSAPVEQRTKVSRTRGLKMPDLDVEFLFIKPR